MNKELRNEFFQVAMQIVDKYPDRYFTFETTHDFKLGFREYDPKTYVCINVVLNYLCERDKVIVDLIKQLKQTFGV